MVGPGLKMDGECVLVGTSSYYVPTELCGNGAAYNRKVEDPKGCTSHTPSSATTPLWTCAPHVINVTSHAAGCVNTKMFERSHLDLCSASANLIEYPPPPDNGADNTKDIVATRPIDRMKRNERSYPSFAESNLFG